MSKRSRQPYDVNFSRYVGPAGVPTNRRERRAKRKMERTQSTMSNTTAGDPELVEMLLRQAPPMVVVNCVRMAKRAETLSSRHRRTA